MEKLDRGYQHAILTAAAAAYPQQLYLEGSGEPRALAGRIGSEIEVNCGCLEEHGLLAVQWVGSLDTDSNVSSIKATARGMVRNAEVS
jgi:hypothetical protein